MKISTLWRLTFGAAALLAAPALLGAQGPSATVSPGDTTINTSATTYNLSVQVTWCSDAPFNDATRTFQLDGVDVSANFTTTGTGAPGCVYGAHSQGTITLTRANDGVHSFWVAIEDINGWYGGGGAGYTLRWPGYVPPKHDVRVRPVSYAIDAGASASRSVQFTITNTGSRPATYNLSRTCVRAATCTGLTPTSVTLDTTPVGRSATATVTFTSGAAGDTALVRLKATNSVYSAAVDSASTDVFIAAASSAPSPGVTLVGANDVTERSLCLTIAAGDGAAYECGDLRLAHALPTVTTWGKARTPTLLYNSAHALPIVAVQADVAPGATVPQTVEARVKIGGVQYGYGSWSGSQWAANTARRVTVPVTTALATGVYAYTFEVTYTWSGGSQTVSSAGGLLPVVNRSASPLGAGWWLAGLEQLVFPGDGSIFWVGGDGSTRRYTSAGTNLWRAANVSRPDSIYLSGSTYVRRLPSGTTVEFDGSGRHVATRPLVGHATYFQYNGSGAISRIVVPTALADGDQTVRYDFTYYADSVVATLTTFGGATRQARALLNAGRLTAIRDPDGTNVLFGYGTGANVKRVESRTDRRNFVTTYSYDAIGHFAGHSLTLAGGQVVAQSFQPAESRGAPGTPNGAAQPVDSAYTLVDGPRTDVTDVSRFWVNRYGAPAKIRNAHGYYTTIVFDDSWPALAKSVRYVGGAIDSATYNARGLVTTVTKRNLRSLGDVASTITYDWDPSVALPTLIVSAEGTETHFAYNADGTPQWTRTGPDASKNVTFSYYSGSLAGLYRASSLPGRSERDSLIYDTSLNNVISAKSRDGFWSYTDRDAFGRVSVTRVQVAAGVWRSDTSSYDLADRIIRQVSVGPQANYAPGGTLSYLGTLVDSARTLTVSNQYDNEGNVVQVSRFSSPSRTSAGDAATTYTYDGANRKLSETHDFTQQYEYDAAGNLTRQVLNGLSVRMQYDALGQLRSRITDSVYYPTKNCSFWGAQFGGGTCLYKFPLSTQGNPLTVPSDTAEFDYDAAGRMIAADNASARIRRTYSPAGLLLTDTARVRTLGNVWQGDLVDLLNFNNHVYGLQYGYDRDGRLTSMAHPGSLVSCPGTPVPEQYAYFAATHRDAGALASLTGACGDIFAFRYSVTGQLDSLLYPNGIAERTTYDGDGLVTRRTIGSGSSSIIDDTLQYDPMGRVIIATGKIARTGASQTIHTVYGGLGAVAVLHTEPSGGTPKLEQFRTDALANRYWSQQYNMTTNANDNPSIRLTNYVGTTQNETWSPNPSTYDDAQHYWYDGAGRLAFKGSRLYNVALEPTRHYQQEAHYYTADGKLVLMERHTGDFSQASGDPIPAVVEAYRYDALGRRVLVTTTRETGCNVAGCESTIERFVWNGDQLLYELRGPLSNPENDHPSGNGDHGAFNAYGLVGYTHARGVDHPIGGVRSGAGAYVIFYPHTNWRGLYETATRTDGAKLTNDVAWPGELAGLFLGATPRSTPYEWFGTLVTEQQDASGLMYRRSRYYDPQTGRFTQPDPIGLAGGLNVYGFATGDPVSYRDPFGLCPPKDDTPCTGDSDMSGAFLYAGRMLKPAQAPLEGAGTVVAGLPLLGAGLAGGISTEVLELGNVLRSGAGSGILTAAGVAQRVAAAVGGTVDELAKSEGFKVTVQASKNIVARIKSSGEMRVGIDRLGSLTREGLISSDRALTHLRDLSSQELIDLMNKGRQLVGAPR